MAGSLQDKEQCKTQFDRPKFDILQSANKRSEDNVTLANLVGYLRFPSKNSYLPLELVSVKQEGTSNRDKEANLTLSTNCCNIKLTRVLDQRGDIEVLIAIENILADYNVLSCEVKGLTIRLNKNEYYASAMESYYFQLDIGLSNQVRN